MNYISQNGLFQINDYYNLPRYMNIANSRHLLVWMEVTLHQLKGLSHDFVWVSTIQTWWCRISPAHPPQDSQVLFGSWMWTAQPHQVPQHPSRCSPHAVPPSRAAKVLPRWVTCLRSIDVIWRVERLGEGDALPNGDFWRF